MKKHEKRNMTFGNIELRAETSALGKKIVEGIIPYDSKSLPMWGTTEIISKTAFNKTLADRATVRALFNHDNNRILGSTDSGTLVLENTESGLICRCELPDTSYANDMFNVIERGDCRNMSFGFQPVSWRDSENGKTRTLKEVKLLEVSYCVPNPAYTEATSVTYKRGFEMRNIDMDKLNDVLEKDELSDDDKTVISETVGILKNIIGDEAVETEPGETTPSETDTLTNENIANIQLMIEAELAA